MAKTVSIQKQDLRSVRSIALFGAAALALTCASIFGSADVRAQTVLKFANVLPDGPAADVEAMKAFKKYVEFRSNGSLQVRLYHASLGGEREITEQVKQGSIEMGLVSDGAVAGFYKKIQILSIPYLFSSEPAAWRFMDHTFADGLRREMREQTGIRVVAFSPTGFRNFTNNVRPITKPEDMKGLKMRTMESPVYMNMMRSMGAAPTPISGAELVLALKQGVVDGQETPTYVIRDFGIAEVQKFMTLDEHIFGFQLVMINDEAFKKLSPDNQRVVVEGAHVLRNQAGVRKASLEPEYIEQIKSKGMKIHMPTVAEKNAFKAVAQGPVRKYLEEQFGVPAVENLMAAVKETEDFVYARP